MKPLQPKLRFPEFKGNWEEKLLDNISIRGSGHTPNKKFNSYYEGTIPWISLADSKFLDNGIINQTSYKISQEGIKNSSAVLHPKGTVILSRDAGVGKSAVMGLDMAVSQHFIVWKPIENELSNWFLYFKLQILKPEFERIAIGSTIKTIGLPFFKQLYITVPNIQEQTKIATFLSSIDNKINQLIQKKSLLEQYKKGIMQKIFSQELRFKDDNGKDFEDWVLSELGSLCNIKTGKLDANAMVKNGIYRFYTCAKNYYQIDKYAFDTEALLISGNGANVGYIHYYEGKFNAYQRTYVLDRFNENIIFIKYLLDFFLYDRIYSEKKEGNTPYIVLSTLSEMQISIPSIKEQTKIANFLSAIDEKINKVSTQLEQTTQHKKGLLQQMFV